MTETVGRAQAGQIAAPRVGTVGVYATGSSLALVRQARALAGQVTVGGRPGKRALSTLDAEDDLHGVDLDPAAYLDRGLEPAQGELFEVDWEARQRSLGLPVVRSDGVYVGAKDRCALIHAFATPVGAGTIRVISLEAWWLRDTLRGGLRGGLRELLARVRECDDPLAFVLADRFDPLDTPGAVDGLRMLLDVAIAGGRRVELLRTDVGGIGFVAAGGSWGTIGTSTSTRHHGLMLPRKAAVDREDRLRSPYVFVPALLSWHRGTELGALSQFDGAGITSCDCPTCNGADLLRFGREWERTVPLAVREEAQAHDLHCCVALAHRVLADANPAEAWARECRSAVATAANIAGVYRVLIKVPASISAWQ